MRCGGAAAAGTAGRADTAGRAQHTPAAHFGLPPRRKALAQREVLHLREEGQGRSMRWRQASLRGVAANPAPMPHPAWFSMQAAPLVVFSTELSQTTQRRSRKPRSMRALTTQEGVRWATSSSSPLGPAAICRPRMRLSAQCFCWEERQTGTWSGGVAAGGAAE